MSLKNQPAHCRCCSSLAQMIEGHFDPDNNLTGDEDAAEMTAEFNDLGNYSADEMDPLEVEEMEAYLAALRENRAASVN
jgi:hypothetical protein